MRSNSQFLTYSVTAHPALQMHVSVAQGGDKRRNIRSVTYRVSLCGRARTLRFWNLTFAAFGINYAGARRGETYVMSSD